MNARRTLHPLIYGLKPVQAVPMVESFSAHLDTSGLLKQARTIQDIYYAVDPGRWEPLQLAYRRLKLCLVAERIARFLGLKSDGLAYLATDAYLELFSFVEVGLQDHGVYLEQGSDPHDLGSPLPA